MSRFTCKIMQRKHVNQTVWAKLFDCSDHKERCPLLAIVETDSEVNKLGIWPHWSLFPTSRTSWLGTVQHEIICIFIVKSCGWHQNNRSVPFYFLATFRWVTNTLIPTPCTVTPERKLTVKLKICATFFRDYTLAIMFPYHLKMTYFFSKKNLIDNISNCSCFLNLLECRPTVQSSMCFIVCAKYKKKLSRLFFLSFWMQGGD